VLRMRMGRKDSMYQWACQDVLVRHMVSKAEEERQQVPSSAEYNESAGSALLYWAGLSMAMRMGPANCISCTVLLCARWV
jgi:hypothetical protein